MSFLKRRKDPQRKRRGVAREVYQSHRWHEYSRQYRKKYRFCVNCKDNGKTILSECVDHIIPISQGGEIWNPINHQPLCLSCHSKKTKEEQR